MDHAPGSAPIANGLGSGHPRTFKRHKILPHPKLDSWLAWADAQHVAWATSPGPAEFATSLSRSSDSTPSLRRQSRRLGSSPGAEGTGPVPPPTPPTHSRTSSSSQSTVAPTLAPLDGRSRGAERPQMRPPTTPTTQRSPPTPNLTPERTPPGQGLVRGFYSYQPVLEELGSPPKVSVDSRTESFKTAPEAPCSDTDNDDNDDHSHSCLRSILPSARTSQITIRQLPIPKPAAVHPAGLRPGPEPESQPVQHHLTPRAKGEFNVFDGKWGSPSGGRGLTKSEVEIEQAENQKGDTMLVTSQAQTAGQFRTSGGQRRKGEEVVEDDVVIPTKATRALRSMSLEESPELYSSRPTTQHRFTPQAAPAPPQPGLPASADFDMKRASVMSSKSTASTVIEAVLVEVGPKRTQTLRHVRKQATLRASASDLSPPSSAPSSVLTGPDTLQRKMSCEPALLNEAARESRGSDMTLHSISSRKARREIWKSGAIPVAVVPDRRSSFRSKEPSLRSTSSRRSKRTQSMGSVSLCPEEQSVPQSERPAQHHKTLSESEAARPRGEQRTIDFPPIIPARSSSLSAPTSRNASRDVSRRGSLTAESLRTHNAYQARLDLQNADHALQQFQVAQVPQIPQVVEPQTGLSSSQEAPYRLQKLATGICLSVTSLDHYEHDQDERGDDEHGGESGLHRLQVDGSCGDAVFGKRLSVRNTPFSQVSVETGVTSHSHAEVSEAMAVSIYPHQNKSLLVVDHLAGKAPPAPAIPERELQVQQIRGGLETEREIVAAPAPPQKQKSLLQVQQAQAGVDQALPSTPPQKPIPFPLRMDDIDSPLRNPRAPPAPPAPPYPPVISLIPATPSGLTPTREQDKQLGSLFDLYAELAMEGEDMEKEEALKPRRSLSLLKRTLGHRDPLPNGLGRYGPSASRTPGILKRTLALTRSVRRRASSEDRVGSKGDRVKATGMDSRSVDLRPPTINNEPLDDSKLHPFWRPAHEPILDDSGDEYESDSYLWDDEDKDRYGRQLFSFPSLDGRSRSPRPSLSLRMRKTLSSLPLRHHRRDIDHDYAEVYPESGGIYGPIRAPKPAPDRRTTRRTPSGNLRVIKHRLSRDSLTRVHPPPSGGRGRGSNMIDSRNTGQDGRPVTDLDHRIASMRNGGNAYQSRTSKSRDFLNLSGPALSTSVSMGVSLGNDRNTKTNSASERRSRAGRHGRKAMTYDPDEGPSAGGGGVAGLLPSLGRSMSLSRRLSERRREKRKQELRQLISAPRDLRDGVGDVIRTNATAVAPAAAMGGDGYGYQPPEAGSDLEHTRPV